MTIEDLVLSHNESEIADDLFAWAYLFNDNYSDITDHINQTIHPLLESIPDVSEITEQLGDITTLGTPADSAVEAINNLDTREAGHFASLVSNYSNPAAPASPNRGQLWFDNSNSASTVLKIRNQANTEWLIAGSIDTATNIYSPYFASSINANNQKLINLTDPVNPQDGCTKAYADTLLTATVPNYVPRQCTNSGLLDSSGQPAALTTGTGLTPGIQAATVNLKGNSYGPFTSFVLSSNFNIPKNAPANRQSTIVLLNGSTGTPATDAAKWDYACQRRQRGRVFDITKNLLVDFKDGTPNDKYGNAVTVIGTPVYTSNKFSSVGTSGLKYNIPTLGQRGWCVELTRSFLSTSNLEVILSTKGLNGYGLVLRRNAANKLELFLSTNGSSWDLANGTGAGLGTKNNYAINTNYDIVIEYIEGTGYRVYVDGAVEISISSQSALFSAITALIFGLKYDEVSNPMQGSMTDLRVTLGNNRYGATGFTPHTVGTFTPDTYWEDTNTKRVLYGSPASWTEKEAVFIGECVASAASISSVKTYAYDRKYKSPETAFVGPGGQVTTFDHNLGYEPDRKSIDTILKCIYPDRGYTYGEEVRPWGSVSGEPGFVTTKDEAQIKNIVNYSGVLIPQKSNGYGYAPTSVNYWREIVIVDESFN